MKLNKNFVCRYNDDHTVTLYDLNNELFFGLNETATIIFENIEQDDENLMKIFIDRFNLPDSFNIRELEECRKELINNFFVDEVK